MSFDRVNRLFLALGLVVLPLQASIGEDDPDLGSPRAAVFDSDIGPGEGSYIANDTAATAQPVPDPVLITGYVNQSGSGPESRSRAVGDVVDVYRVLLRAGDRITLSMAGDGVQDDLDLGLADLDGNLLDASAGPFREETLTAKTAGDALVLVGASRGASRYELSIGAPRGPVARFQSMRLSDPFVAGEVIVNFHQEPTGSPTGLRVQAQAAGAFAARQTESQQRNVLLKFEDLKAASGERTSAAAAPAAFPGGFLPVEPNLRAKLDTMYRVKELSRNPDVRLAGLNYIRQIQFAPNDPYYPFQWHYPLINLPQAWDVTTGANSIVAVIDTGVATSHPDLQGQLVAGYDFIRDPASANDGDGIDPNPDDPGDRARDDGSSSFHGTHVTGTVVAATNNGVGVAGVAFGAKVMPLRALGVGGGTDYDIEQAIRFAAGLPNDSGTVPTNRADVINMSLGGPGISSTSQAVYDQARAAGVIIVSAAGNQGTGELNYPAALPGVIAVAGVDLNRARAYYSNFGSWVDVTAPGGDITKDLNNDGRPDGVLSTATSDRGGVIVNDYSLNQGTSMATPHVAGVVALMRAVNPGLTPQRFDELLASGALTDDLGAPGKDDLFGYGLINAKKAVEAARGVSISGSYQTINPASSNFGINVGTLAPSP